MVVAQVADAAFVGVTYSFLRCEPSGFNLEAHLFVGIAEGYACKNQPVYLFHTEDERIFIVGQNGFVYLYLLHHQGNHTQTVFQFVECRQEHLLDNLKIAEVTRRQVVADKRDLLRQRLNLIAFGPRELEHIRILLWGMMLDPVVN